MSSSITSFFKERKNIEEIVYWTSVFLLALDIQGDLQDKVFALAAFAGFVRIIVFIVGVLLDKEYDEYLENIEREKPAARWKRMTYRLLGITVLYAMDVVTSFVLGGDLLGLLPGTVLLAVTIVLAWDETRHPTL